MNVSLILIILLIGAIATFLSGASLELYEFAFVLLDLLLDILFVVLYVNELVAHLTHYQAAAIQGRGGAHRRENGLLLLHRGRRGVSLERGLVVHLSQSHLLLRERHR